MYKYFAMSYLLLCCSACINQKPITSEPNANPTTTPQIGFVEYMDQVINSDGIDAAMEWFDTHQNGATHPVVEDDLNRLAYTFLYNYLRTDDAIKLMELNARRHPNSANVYDSLGEAFLRKGDYEKSVANYTTAAMKIERKSMYHLGFLPAQAYSPTVLPDQVEDLFIAEGNMDNKQAFVFLQGGPDHNLNINRHDGLHLMSNHDSLLKIYPFQAQMLNPLIMHCQPSLTMDQSSFENGQSVEILDRVVRHLVSLDKQVFVIGHSYGASICMEYVNAKEVLADKVVIMGLDLDEDISHWESLAPGEYTRWEKGEKPYAKIVFGWMPQDYPAKSSFHAITDNLEMIIKANMQKKYTETIPLEVYEKLVFVHANEDEANGKKSVEELAFLNETKAIVVETTGDHHSMMTNRFMDRVLGYLTSGANF